MDSIYDLVPKNKFDNSNLGLLKTIEPEKASPILNGLLEWIQDINWPVALELLDILPRFHSGLVPHIKAVLNSGDNIWKNWILLMIKQFPKETIELLSFEIKRIVEYPTESELADETNEYALTIINMFNL